MRREVTGRASWGVVEGGVPLLPWGTLPAILPADVSPVSSVDDTGVQSPPPSSDILGKDPAAGTVPDKESQAGFEGDSTIGVVDCVDLDRIQTDPVRGVRVVLCHSFHKIVVCSGAGFSVWRASPTQADAAGTAVETPPVGDRGTRGRSHSSLFDYASGSPAVFLRVGDILTHGGSPPPCAAVLLVEPSELDAGGDMQSLARAIDSLIYDRKSAAGTRDATHDGTTLAEGDPVDSEPGVSAAKGLPPLAWPTGMTCRLHYVEED